jgi:putative toxin-antitoxin system antitoxin component (TIGR02293 family)
MKKKSLLLVSHDPAALIQHSRNGICKSELLALQEEIKLTTGEIQHILHINNNTLNSYKNSDLLNQDTSERILLLAQLYARGFQIMGKERFLRWMDKNLIVFGNQKAKNLLDTFFGFQHLYDELGRIEHGVLA